MGHTTSWWLMSKVVFDIGIDVECVLEKAGVKLLRGKSVVCRQKNRSSYTTASDTGRHIKSKE